ncbi:hypothetical protein CD006_14885 [Enterobacter sp. 10-1]|nr:hypothetical protein CD006_14885 [Enterobacter sp. 10-1]
MENGKRTGEKTCPCTTGLSAPCSAEVKWFYFLGGLKRFIEFRHKVILSEPTKTVLSFKIFQKFFLLHPV